MDKEYLKNIRRLLEHVETTQAETIDVIAGKCAEAIYKEKLLYFFGTGHSHMICEEPFYRAGGLASIYPILEPSFMLHEGASKSSCYERVQNSGTVAVAQSGIGKGDVLFVISNSGRNCAPIDAAIEGKRRGAVTVAITSLRHSGSVASRHPNGKRLFEVCDYCLDNGGEPGDASVSLEGMNQKIGPTSSIIDMVMVNLVIVETVRKLLQKGIKPPVFISANVDNGEEINSDIIAEYQKRIKIL